MTVKTSLLVALVWGCFLPAVACYAADVECSPTRGDALGPYYKSNAPVRDAVGTGYMLDGTVKNARDCTPVAGARIELWLAGPDGTYDDAHRATVFSDSSGGYRFQSNVPSPYGGRPPHIHIRVSAAGFNPLVTQHYPPTGSTHSTFDLVLTSAK